MNQPETLEVLRQIAESLKALPELLSALRESQPEKQPPTKEEIRRMGEERGISIALRMEKPTQRAVARAMGLKCHSEIRKFPAVLEAIRRLQMVRTISRGNGRSITDHTMADASEF